jgi:serine/threonine protein phosphatase PrpC
VKSCPACGAIASDDDAFCDVDGSRLEPLSAATLPPVSSGGRCGWCGTRYVDVVDGCCTECGHRLVAARSTLPGAIPLRIDQYTVVRVHGDCDLVVTDESGATRLLVFGPDEAMTAEENALLASASSKVFPMVVSRGATASLRSFLVLDVAVDPSVPIDGAKLSFCGALAVVRAVLDAAEEMESRGFAWAPLSSDLRVMPSGELHVMRARSARRLMDREAFDAKKVLEGLGAALLPAPLTLGTPELTRLFLPGSNFSTAPTQTIQAAREQVDRAEAAFCARETGALACICDPGLRRNHNEDATGVAQGEVKGEPFAVLVACDGVSSSTHAERASSLAVDVVREVLTRFASSGDILVKDPSAAVVGAICSAHDAICAAPFDHGDGPPPGTTIVAAIVFRRTLTVGWVGDSRAYWVSEQGAELCTTDHSWVNEAVASGEWSESAAMASPLAHALTMCLGPLETDDDDEVQTVQPDVRTKVLQGKGHLVLCTDGLWNYFPSAEAIGDLVRDAGPDASAAAIARFLVCHALCRGGGDNVTVAVHAVS